MLACCISGFVTTNRFGFALEGSWCAFDRFYYDSFNGQLKNIYPKWEGFDTINENLTNIENFLTKIKEKSSLREDLLKIGNKNMIKSENINYKYDGYFTEDYINKIVALILEDKEIDFVKKINEITLPIAFKYGKIIDSIYILQNFDKYIKSDSSKYNISDFKNFMTKIKNDFSGLKDEFLKEYYYFARIARGWGKILTMIYLCLLCITVTFEGFSMMFYVCLKRQGYLQIFMHVLWNITRFFMFSFFFYGAAYGMCFLALRDAVAYVMFVFGEDNLNLNDKNSYLIPKNEGKKFLHYCLINNDNNYKNQINPILISALEDYFKSYSELKILLEDRDSENDLEKKATNVTRGLYEEQHNIYVYLPDKIDGLKQFCNNENCDNLLEASMKQGGLFGYLDCSFLKSDLAMIYRTLYDMSVEARILCALSCCIAFFGAIFIYFFLLVLHHYNAEIFFDNGKSIFIGFDAYGNTKKNNKDPVYKKRKIRSEIELSSRNEEYDANNNKES